MGKSKLLYQAINIWELKHKDMQGNYYSEVKIVLIIIGMRHMEASWGISNILFVDLGGDFSCFHLMIIPWAVHLVSLVACIYISLIIK